MKLYATIAVHVDGEQLLRRAGWLDRLRAAFGGEPDLTTGTTRAALEATAVVDSIRAALASVGVRDAVSLVIDDLVVFSDRDRRADDLGDLFLAFHEHADVIGGGFRSLRLAVEHVDAGIHHVLEVQARTEHPSAEPAVRVIASGRIQAFAARPGEDAEAYRARVAPLVADRMTIEVARTAFRSFVERVRDAVAHAMPDARAEIQRADLRVDPPAEHRRRQGARPEDDPEFDPHAAYYPSPLAGMLGAMAMSTLGVGLATGDLFGGAAAAAQGLADADGAFGAGDLADGLGLGDLLGDGEW